MFCSRYQMIARPVWYSHILHSSPSASFLVFFFLSLFVRSFLQNNTVYFFSHCTPWYFTVANMDTLLFIFLVWFRRDISCKRLTLTLFDAFIFLFFSLSRELYKCSRLSLCLAENNTKIKIPIWTFITQEWNERDESSAFKTKEGNTQTYTH